jgi:hypothetical protein
MGWIRNRRAVKDEMEFNLDGTDEVMDGEAWVDELTREFPELQELQPEEPTGDTLTQVFEDFAREIEELPLADEGIGRIMPKPARWEDIHHCEECGTITPADVCLTCSYEAALAEAEAIAEDDALELERGLRDQD